MNTRRAACFAVGIVGAAVGVSASVAGTPACNLVVHADDYVTQECATNQDCITAHNDPNWICRKSDKTCQGLISGDCPMVLGAQNLTSDDTLLFGSLFALTGPNSSFGLGELEATKLAYGDFTTAGNGLPPLPGQTARRQMTLVICDDQASNGPALSAVTHMTKDLAIPAIVGPTWSGPTINFLTTQSIPAGALTIAAGATSPDLTSLAKGNPILFYRTSESTSIEAPAIAKLSANVEMAVGAALNIAGKVSLALVYKGDAFGTGTAQVVKPALTLNGKQALDPANTANFYQADYGNPADPMTDPLKYTQTVQGILNLKPNIIIPIGTGEVFGSILGPTEQMWPANTPKPIWVFPHTGVSTVLLTQMGVTDPTNEDLRRRIVGILYGPNPSNPASPGSAAFNAFVGNFIASTPGDTSPYSPSASNAYDAFYVLAFAAVANGAKPVTGANLSLAIPTLTSGQTTINVGPADLNTALSTLAQGQPIKIVGTSGPLDFNTMTGDVEEENQVWCVPLTATHSLGYPQYSGYGFDLNFNPSGSISSVNTACQVTFNPGAPAQ